MAFIPFDKVAMVEIRMLNEGQQCENTLYVQFPDSITEEDLTGLANNIRDWWDGSVSPLLPTAVSLAEIVCTDLTDAESLQVTLGGGGLTGGMGGSVLPNNVSFAISFRTGTRGRSFRGRNYIAAITADSRVGTNGLDPDFVASWIAAYGGLLTAVLGPGQVWVVASRFQDGAPRVTGLATPVITVVATDNTLDSMRRRLPGRGA